MPAKEERGVRRVIQPADRQMAGFDTLPNALTHLRTHNTHMNTHSQVRLQHLSRSLDEHEALVQRLDDIFQRGDN